jgi:hypothetical protein
LDLFCLLRRAGHALLLDPFCLLHRAHLVGLVVPAVLLVQVDRTQSLAWDCTGYSCQMRIGHAPSSARASAARSTTSCICSLTPDNCLALLIEQREQTAQ